MTASTDPRTAEAELFALLAEFPGGIPRGPQRDELQRRSPDLEAVQQRFTNDAALQRLCATALRKLGRFDAALTAALAAHRLEPSPQTVQTLCGVLGVAARAGHLVRRFEDALEPDDLDTWLAGAHALAEASCFRDAARWFEHVLRRQPKHVEARALRAYALWLLTIDPAWVAGLRAMSAEHPESTLVTGLLAEMEPARG